MLRRSRLPQWAKRVSEMTLQCDGVVTEAWLPAIRQDLHIMRRGSKDMPICAAPEYRERTARRAQRALSTGNEIIRIRNTRSDSIDMVRRPHALAVIFGQTVRHRHHTGLRAQMHGVCFRPAPALSLERRFCAGHVSQS